MSALFLKFRLRQELRHVGMLSRSSAGIQRESSRGGGGLYSAVYLCFGPILHEKTGISPPPPNESDFFFLSI